MGTRVVVTGVNGFVGRHLVAELKDHGYDVVGIGHEAEPAVEHLADYVAQDLVHGWPGNLDAGAVVHLAGLSAVGPSFEQPQRYLEQNSAMVTHLGEALIRTRSAARVLVVSSGAVYDPHQDLPLTEESRIRPTSPYVVSKLLVEQQVAYYATRGLDAVVARPFNHIGPGQGPGFLVPDLYDAVRRAAGTDGVLRVGDLDTRRDYTDVRDVVRAYRLLLEADALGDRLFNVCSGRSWSGRELLHFVLEAKGIDRLAVEVDPARLRPGDPREVVGSSARLTADVGWAPEINIPTSVRDFVSSRRSSSLAAP